MSEQAIPDERDVDDLTDEELRELAEGISDIDIGLGSHPKPKEKQDIMAFFNNILNRDDTTKVSNLGDEELEAVRRMKRAALLALSMDWNYIAIHIKKRAEIILATGLSGKDKGGFFLKIINTSRKMLESVTTKGVTQKRDTSGGNRGWFGRRKQ